MMSPKQHPGIITTQHIPYIKQRGSKLKSDPISCILQIYGTHVRRTASQQTTGRRLRIFLCRVVQASSKVQVIWLLCPKTCLYFGQGAFTFRIILVASQKHYIIIIMKRQSFLLPQCVTLQLQSLQTTQTLAITYYSDCVFQPYVYNFNNNQFQIPENKHLKINFNFLFEKIKEHPKILDNIGVLKIDKLQRFGILVTKEKQGIFVSIID